MQLPLKNDLFLRACRGEKTERPPVWIMRQAGRYMPEYQEIRKKTSFLGLCKTPDLAAQATMLPIEMLGVDAAILFSDILIPVEAMGMELHFSEHKGPSFPHPIQGRQDVDRLLVPDPVSHTGFVAEAIREINKRLSGRVPLIGFSGAPFTLATYMVEGEISKDFSRVKQMMFSDPATLHTLLDRITETVIRYLEMQIEAGIHAYQIFDTWAGSLSPVHYRSFALPYVRRIVDSLKRYGIPSILYVNGSCSLLEDMVTAGTDVVSVDWRMSLSSVRERVPPAIAIQGNLDPVSLLGSPEILKEETRRVMEEMEGRSGYVFNLGHGILPSTPVSMAQYLVSLVQKGPDVPMPHNAGRR
jgi:uroporphyrinogen decarboxylase